MAKQAKAKSSARSRTRPTAKSNAARPRDQVPSVLAVLRDQASTRILEEMFPRYGILARKAFGVPVNKIHLVAKDLHKRNDGAANHALAAELWATGWYEARMLCAFIDDPSLVTSAQMDRWCKDFDNWGICDTLCFHLFDRTPYAWKKVARWATSDREFIKRASFALLASLALHERSAPDELFLESFPLIERAAADDRNFVKKSVSWALRSIGGRNSSLHAAAIDLAHQLADAPNDISGAARWVGKDALRSLASPAVIRRIARNDTNSQSKSSPTRKH